MASFKLSVEICYFEITVQFVKIDQNEPCEGRNASGLHLRYDFVYENFLV